MRNSRGFTLIEIMLVMAIIAIIGSTVMLTLPTANQNDNKSRDLANTLKYQFSVAREYSMLHQRPVGLYINKDEQRYEFVEWYDNEWQPLRKKGLKPQRLEDFRWQFDRNNGFAVVENERQRDEFLISEVDEDDEQKDNDEDDPVLQPQVLILPSGEIGDFRLSLRYINELDNVWLQTNTPWQLEVTGSEDENV